MSEPTQMYRVENRAEYPIIIEMNPKAAKTLSPEDEQWRTLEFPDPTDKFDRTDGKELKNPPNPVQEVPLHIWDLYKVDPWVKHKIAKKELIAVKVVV